MLMWSLCSACAQTQSTCDHNVTLTLGCPFLWQLQINYTRLLDDLDTELKEDLRSGRHLPRIVDKALRLFNLKQVVQEVETSVMSKVSCTACKAGNYTLVHSYRPCCSLQDETKQNRLSGCNWSALVPTFAGWGVCRVVSARLSHLRFLDWSRYFSFK
jgi:hypothetical protein